MTILDHRGKSLMHDHIAYVGTGLSTEIVDDGDGSYCPEGVFGELTLPATTRRWKFFSSAAVHFSARSEAVTDQRVLRFSACQAGVQRLRPFRSVTPRANPGHELPFMTPQTSPLNVSFSYGSVEGPALELRDQCRLYLQDGTC